MAQIAHPRPVPRFSPRRFYEKALDTYRGWGTDDSIRTREWECQKYVPEPNETFFRGVRVAAPKDVDLPLDVPAARRALQLRLGRQRRPPEPARPRPRARSA